MKQRTLLTDRPYYGLDPLSLRAATSRALARVVGLPPERARVSATSLRHDFSLDTAQAEALVKEFVAEGPARASERGKARLRPHARSSSTLRVRESSSRCRARGRSCS